MGRSLHILRHESRLQECSRRSSLAAVLSLGLLGCCPLLPSPTASADDATPAVAEDLSAELPRIAPVEPGDAEKTLAVAPGYRVDLVAAEPLVSDPIAMSFDGQGRLFVVEMHDYSEDDEGKLGIVRLLTDTDGDGRFDQSSIYADNLSWPTAICCYDDGVFVGAAPDILFLKDTDGDGRADEQRKVFTGFNRSNVQGLLNSFCWGLDNRIHGATSSAGASVRRADDERAKPLVLSGRDFAFDPRTLTIEATSGGGQYGMTFDKWGRKYVCSNSDHIQQVMYEDRYVARNPFFAAPSARISIAPDGPQAEIYRASPVEPWRVVRTRLRVTGKVPGPIEGGGRASGYFTGATGITIYRGNAWPAADEGLAIVGDACTNLAHRKRLEPHGLERIARRIDNNSEFVAAKDIWFRPVQFANAPDGGLYIADMYREVIEHPASLPPEIKKHLDLTSGRDRGRVYRIVGQEYRQPALPRLAQAPTAELVATLAHANGWHRETAARLIFERQDAAVVPLLEELVSKSASPAGRMHALYALHGLSSLSSSVLTAALADLDPHVRTHAVRLSEKLLHQSDAVKKVLLSMAENEQDLEVQYQLMFTLGEAPPDWRSPAIVKLARRSDAGRWMQLALLSSLGDGIDAVFTPLVSDVKFRQADSGQQILAALAQQAGASARQADVTAVLTAIDSLPSAEIELAGQLVRALSEGAARQGGSLEKYLAGKDGGVARSLMTNLLSDARIAAADPQRSASNRTRAIGLLAQDGSPESYTVLKALIDSHQPQEIQLAALAALGRSDDKAVAATILAAWPTLSPRLRSPAIEALFARSDRLPTLLTAIEQGTFATSNLDPARIQQLLKHPDAGIRDHAGRLLSAANLGRRREVVAAFQPALTQAGDPQAGKKHFQKVCAACHRVEGVGSEIGANLAAMKGRGAEAILVNVLDPNREVNPQFVNYILTTTDGRSLTGIIDAESAASVTLKRAENATDTILRVNIDELFASGLSLMPEGIEEQLGETPAARQQALADLIAYLLSAR